MIGLLGCLISGTNLAGLRADYRPVPATPPTPDVTGEATGNHALIGERPSLEQVADFAGKNRVAINMAWVLLAGFLVFFMQAGFAMIESGLTRAKNVAHTMAMNVMIFSIGTLGFWACGFALMYGNHGALPRLGTPDLLHQEFSLALFGHEFGLFGHEGFFLSGRAADVGLLALFLFQVMFMDTAATIPTGAMAERWKFLAFVIYGFVMSMIIYPVYGNWVWGHGWLARLGANFGLGHGHVDFAGSSVVHMVGGFTALVGAWLLGPRIGKYRPDGTPNPLPAHNIPMYMLGTLFLIFGWFGFNAGSTLGSSDLNIARIAVNTILASAAGSFVSMCTMWFLYSKPDPSFLCNGMLAGLVSITAP
jgi:Amt family ammonium transporter